MSLGGGLLRIMFSYFFFFFSIRDVEPLPYTRDLGVACLSLLTLLMLELNTNGIRAPV